MNRWIGLFGVMVLCLVGASVAGAQTDNNTPASPLPVGSPYDANLFDPGLGVDGAMLGRVFLVLLIVVVLAVAVLLLTKRLMGRIGQGPGKRIRIKETCALGPRKALHWVEAGRQRFLIASTSDRVVLISELLDEGPWEVTEDQEEAV